MKYKTLSHIDKPLSSLTYGTPYAAARGDLEQALQVYDRAWDAGFRTFDTAHSYGAGEEMLGEWLKRRGHRNEAVILDKGCNPRQHGSDDVFSGKTIRSQMEESLRRLQTDHVELYLLHRDDPSLPVDEIVEELNQLKREGKVLRFGGSNWSLDRTQQANAYAKAHGLEGFTACSPAFSLARFISDPWGGSVSISGEENRDFRQWLTETNLPVFCYSSLGRGYLSGKYIPSSGKAIENCLNKAPIMEYDAPENRARLDRAEQLALEKGCSLSQVALAWLLHQPLELFPIVSPSSSEHMLDNVKALELELTKEECDWVYGG